MIEAMGWIIAVLATICGAGFVTLWTGAFVMSRVSDHGPGDPPKLPEGK